MKLRSTFILCTLLIPLAAGSVLFHATLRLFAQDKAAGELPAATERPLTPAVEPPKPAVPAPPATPALPATNTAVLPSPIEPPKPVDLPEALPPVRPPMDQPESSKPLGRLVDQPETRKPLSRPVDQPEVKITHFKYVLADQKALPLAQVLKRIYPRVEFLVDEPANAILVTNGTPQSHKRLEEFLTHSELSPDEKAKRGLPDNIREFLEGQAREMLAVNPPVSTSTGGAVSFVEVVPGRGPANIPGTPGIPAMPMPGIGGAPMTLTRGVAYLPQDVPVSPEQQRYIAKDRQAQQLATLLREKSQRSPEDVKAVKDAVQQAFDLRQEMLRREVQEFRERLDRLSKTLEEREQGKARIIDRRVEELLNPELGWSVEDKPTGSTTGTSYGVRKTEVVPGVRSVQPVAPNETRKTRTAPLEMPGGMPGQSSVPRLASGPREKLETMVISLKHARAGNLAKTLLEVQGEDTFKVRMTGDEATNTLIVFGTPADLKTLTGLIEQLDIPPVAIDGQASGGFGTTGISGQASPPGRTESRSTPRSPGGGQPIKFDDETKKVDPDAPAMVSVFALQHAKAGELAVALQDFANDGQLFVRITVDPATNSLIVTATTEATQIVSAFLKRLDIAPQPAKDAKTADPQAENLKMWQGRWLMANAVDEGKEVKDASVTIALTVSDHSVKLQSSQPGTEGAIGQEGILTLSRFAGKGAFDIQFPEPLMGIYEFRDGLLVLGFYESGSKKAGTRPENLDSAPDSGLQLYKFDRVAEKKAEDAPATPTIKR